MKSVFLILLTCVNHAATAFMLHRGTSAASRRFMYTPDPERMKQIMEEEARKPENMKATADMLKNLKPEDMDSMIKEMESMPEAQRQQLEAMGMNPLVMKQSIEMMKNNPQMAKQMASMMETMSPDEIMEKSRQAQEMFATGLPQPSASPDVMEAEIVPEGKSDEEDEDEDEEDSEPIPPPSAEILDTLYRTAELMSSPPDGKVTLAGFSTIPPISLLIGNDEDEDISKEELKECWADASLGATRVDRVGFERLWVEVQGYFWDPIIENARKRTVAKKQGVEKPKATSPIPPPPASSSLFPKPQVGQNISPDQLEKQVKNMSDTDMDMMLEQMNNLSPEQEARMKAMGVDPEMMKKTASVMKNNPLMKNAAKMMMKNMSPEQMKQASQTAQNQMAKMSPEEIKKAMDVLDREAKQ